MPPPRKPQTDAAEALVAVAPIVSRWIERLLAQHNPPLTVSQYLALRAIAGEPLTGSELARRTGVSGPAISQVLAALAETGMLERHPNPGDRRHQTLRLSIEGVRTYDSARATLKRSVGALLSELPHPEARALGQLLPRVEAAIAGTAPPRKPRPPPPPRRPRPGKRP